MALPRKTPPPAARGAVTWVGLLMLAALAGGAYLAWTWAPVLMADYEVRQVVRDFGNRAVKDRDDARLVQQLVAQLRSLDGATLAAEGAPADGPRRLAALRPQDVVWERPAENQLHVAFSYERLVPLPLTDRQLERVMTVDLDLDTTRADWGPSK